ncbi:TonB-linked SusC/RagA family outer membrane protein [Pedobacter africanus]|uniref:TonB-linked SusC/RagA family outer membrane protein n=1 Tax=Pedobacter africanus TaxID=151894 RepID=A0ACC6KYJ5_9SPHI|nr:SusC/RagA family TonB-linked outer membrane protein [Pedobacter africanus]MDR6784281.1 TonB-linked SusC/RagA family outer membrane protein [Pedobacter africanus]
MKLTVILLIIGCVQVSAESYSQKITLVEKNTTFNNLFGSIRKQSGYTFFYNNKIIKEEGRISVSVKDASIEETLDLIFKGRSFSYTIINRTVVIKKEKPGLLGFLSNMFSAIDIKGRVVDKEGNPLPGASVMIKGSGKGTSTSTSGNFSIDAKEGDVLVVKFLGYVTKEIALTAGTTTLNIVLDADLQDLSEVVVTALGIKRSEKALGYSVQKIGGKDLQTVKGVDLGTSLSGRVAGLEVRNSTEFNATPTLVLRGETARLIIDGVDYDNLSLRDIPTDDIESINILKGPAASALYGSRAANGVYIITTKKGASDKKGVSADFNSNTMFQLGYLSMPEVQSSYGRGLNGDIGNDYVWGPKLDVGNTATDWNPVTKQMEANRPMLSLGKDNLKNFMNTGIVSNNNISIAQSAENGSFRLGLNHVYNKGQFPNQELNMFNLTGAGEIIVSPKFKIEGRFGLSRQSTPQTWGSGYNNQGYLYQIIMWTGTEYDIRDYKDYWTIPNKTQNWMYTNWYDNPYLIAYEKLSGSIENTMNTTFSATYNFSKDLNLLARMGYDNYNNETTMRNPTSNIYSNRGGWDAKGMYSIGTYTGFSITNDVILNYNKKIGDFSVEALAGASLFYKEDKTFSGSTKNGLISPTFFSLRGSVEPATVNQVFSPRKNNSVYGRAAFGWKDAVFLDFTGRNDWMSTQPANNRSYFYPSAGSSIILSELIKMPKVIDLFKLRGSLTLVKKPAGIFEINKTYGTSTNVWNGLNSASYPTTILNFETLLPSSERTWEIGGTAYLFKKRLHVDVNYFNKYYFNTQASPSIPQSSGFSSTLVNTDETRVRRGFEVTVDGSIIKGSKFEWNSMINWSNQHQYYDDLDALYSPDSRWVYKGARTDIYTSGYWVTDADGQLVHTASGMPLLSTSGNARDVKKYGYGDPTFTVGFINNFTYGNWNLGLNIDGRVGGYMYNYVYDYMFETGTAPETDNAYRYDQVVNKLNNYVGQGVKLVSGTATYDKYGNITADTRVYAPNDVKVGYQTYARSYRGGDRGIQNKTFIKLRELSLGYNIPQKVLSKVGLKRGYVAVTGQNLFMWTNFKYSDPDVNSEDLNSPSQRVVGFNIKLGL